MLRAEPPENDTESGSYRVEGGRLIVTKTADDGGLRGREIDFCVTGATAKVRELTATGDEIRYTLER